MKLNVEWDGSQIPFQGDRTIPIRTIPEGATIESARVTVTPVDPGATTSDLNDSFLERIVFSGPGSNWGATKFQGADFVEVDFHARRLLASATVSGLGVGGGNLQIDPGGVYVEINSHGAIFTPTPGETRLVLTNIANKLPSFLVARFKISQVTLPPANTPNITEVLIHSVPENVNLRLGSNPTFHTFLGQMTSSQDSVDFAPLLKEALAGAKVENGFYNIELVVHSDTIARLKVNLALEVQQEQKPLQGVPESVLGFSVNAIPVGAATQFKFDIPAGSEAVAGRSAVRFQGAFDDTRIAFGPLAPELTGLEATISAGETNPAANKVTAPSPQAQAQPFTIPKNLNIIGIDILLTPQSDAADVLVDIRDDLGGKPGLTSLLPAPLKVTVKKSPSAGPQWLTTALPAELHLSGGQPRWLMVTRSVGNVTWSAQAATDGPGLQQTTDEALSWRTTAAGAATKLEALFRLRNRPPQFTMPIHVFLGEGKDREEVSLKQFEPLGRVDFVLDTEEFAAAINQVAAKTAQTECQSVEHLLNPDLEEWLRSGNAPNNRILQSSFVAAMVLAPDGAVIYTLDLQGVVHTIDPLCGREIGVPLTLSLSSVTSSTVNTMAVTPDGKRLFAARGPRVCAVDTVSMTETGFVDFKTGGQIHAIAAGGGRVFMIHVITTTDVIDFDEAALMQIITTKNAPTFQELHIIAPAQQGAVSIAATADGRTVSIVIPNVGNIVGTVKQVIKPATSKDSVSITAGTPAGVTLFPDGKQAIVTLSNFSASAGSRIKVVNLETGSIVDGPAITVSPSTFLTNHISLAAITADRLVIFGVEPDSDGTLPQLEVIDFGVAVPKWWDLTTGAILPVSLQGGDPHVINIGGWLGKRAAPSPLSSISQVVAVQGGCPFEFSFLGAATSLGAAADIIWRGDKCASTRTDTIPITPKDGVTFCASPLPLELHRLRVRAPENATQAEVRFRATDGVNAVIDHVSLKPPPGPLNNTDFAQATPDGVPAGWTLEPANAPGFSFQNGEIKNLGVDSFAIVQEVSVTAGRPFRLEFEGEVKASGDKPVAAVHWVGADPVLLELNPGAGGLQVAAGKIPDGVTTAEVSITLPAGSSIRPDAFLLRTGVTTGVTFSVFAEAPGELTVSQLRIVSDTKPPAPPKVPPDGLCPSTKPGNDPDAPDDCNLCPSCEEEVKMEHQTKTATISGRPVSVTVSTCPNCDGMIVRNPRTPSVPVQPTAVGFNLPTFPVPRLPARAQLTPGALKREAIVRAGLLAASSATKGAPVRARTSALYAIASIGHEEVKSLEASGITNIDQLLALTPKELSDMLPGKALTRPRLLLGLAQKVKESKAE